MNIRFALIQFPLWNSIHRFCSNTKRSLIWTGLAVALRCGTESNSVSESRNLGAYYTFKWCGCHRNLSRAPSTAHIRARTRAIRIGIGANTRWIMICRPRRLWHRRDEIHAAGVCKILESLVGWQVRGAAHTAPGGVRPITFSSF